MMIYFLADVSVSSVSPDVLQRSSGSHCCLRYHARGDNLIIALLTPAALHWNIVPSTFNIAVNCAMIEQFFNLPVTIF